MIRKTSEIAERMLSWNRKGKIADMLSGYVYCTPLQLMPQKEVSCFKTVIGSNTARRLILYII